MVLSYLIASSEKNVGLCILNPWFVEHFKKRLLLWDLDYTSFILVVTVYIIVTKIVKFFDFLIKISDIQGSWCQLVQCLKTYMPWRQDVFLMVLPEGWDFFVTEI